jgi:hypothetical protein
VDRGQVLGGVLGIVTLLAAFLLPFSSIAEGSTNSLDSLLVIFKIFVIGVTNLQTVGLTQLAELAYIYMASFIIIVVAGLVGAFPRWSAFLGIVGMATLTFSPFAVFTSYSLASTGFGVGFYAIWVTSILGFFAAYWSRKERRSMTPETVQPPTVSQPSPA